MKKLIQSILGLTLFVSMTVQVSAQCIPSTLKNQSNAKGGHVFGSDSFGQSVKPSACAAGSTFSAFSFWANGNSPTKMNLVVYEGDGIEGAVVYEQEDISLPPGNRGGKLSIQLEGGAEHGTGLKIDPDKFYTFMLTIASRGGGNLIAHATQDATNGVGKAYFKASRRPVDSTENIDLRFDIEIEEPKILLCPNDPQIMISVDKVEGETIHLSAIRQGGGLTVYPPNTGGTLLEFENVSANLTRADGVGPQTGKSSATWVVQRTDATKPAVIKWKNVCRNMSVILLE